MPQALLKRVRLTIGHNPDDPADDLRLAARLRCDLWAHSPVEIDPDSRMHGTHRDADKNAYFEFVTELLPEVERVLDEYDYKDRITLAVVDDEVGENCQNCGNFAGEILPTVCPTCNHRDISPCPHCGAEVSRQEYEEVSGDLFICPRQDCRRRVRLTINPDLWKADGTLNEPVVLVEDAQGDGNGNHR